MGPIGPPGEPGKDAGPGIPGVKGMKVSFAMTETRAREKKFKEGEIVNFLRGIYIQEKVKMH